MGNSYTFNGVAELIENLKKTAVVMQRGADEVVEDFAKNDFVPALKAATPSSDKPHSRKYRDGWRVKREKNKKGKTIYRVVNVNRPELTRIQEFGYEKRLNSGRTFVAEPQPHIRPTILKTEPIFIEKLKKQFNIK